jgi:hypothetical protein
MPTWCWIRILILGEAGTVEKPVETVENAKRPRANPEAGAPISGTGTENRRTGRPRSGPGSMCMQREGTQMEIMLKIAGARLAAGIAEDIAGLLVVILGLILIALRRRR